MNSVNLLAKVADNATLDLAFHWCCKSREHFPESSDIWLVSLTHFQMISFDFTSYLYLIGCGVCQKSLFDLSIAISEYFKPVKAKTHIGKTFKINKSFSKVYYENNRTICKSA